MKSAESRIYNLVTDIPKLLAPHFGATAAEAYQFAIYHWMNNNPAQIIPIGQCLSLADVDNSSRFRSADKYAHYRDLTRVYLLFESTFGSSVSRVIQETKNRLLSVDHYGNASEAVTRLRPGVNQLAAMNFRGSYTVGFHEQDRIRKVKQGYSDAKALLTLINGRLANPNALTRTRVAYWFGAGSAIFNSVQQNFLRMSSCIGQRRFLLKPAVEFGQTELKDIYGETGMGLADAYPNVGIDIGFGKTYFDNACSTRKPKLATINQAISDFTITVNNFNRRLALGETGAFGQLQKDYYSRLIRKHSGTINRKSVASFAGTIIHELSHSKLRTDDLHIRQHLNVPNNSITALYAQENFKVYGHYFAHLLAQTNPASALNNADNYRLFSESFFDDF